MTFDRDRVMSSKFEPRTANVPIKNSDLTEFFESEEPVWKVRGMTGEELGKVMEAVQNTERIQEAVGALLSDSSPDIVKGVRKLFNRERPDDVIKRIESLVLASLEPECDLQMAVKVLKFFPIEFYAITNKINTLTGLGHSIAKKKPSGETRQ